MDLEARLFDLLYGQLGYPGTVSKADLKLICQGHARPVVLFLLSTVVNEATKRKISLNLRVNESQRQAETPQTARKSEKLIQISALERKLAGLKRDFLVKSMQRDVQQAFTSRLHTNIQDFTQLTSTLSATSSPLLAPQPLPEAEERLLAAGSQLEALCTDTALPPADSALLILQAAEVLSALPEALRTLVGMAERDKESIAERSGVSLAEAALKQGFLYQKEGQKGTLQRKDAWELLVRLRKEVNTQRDREWDHFLQVESVLRKAKDLRKTLRKVRTAKAAMQPHSPSLAHYLQLELEVNSLKAELCALEQGLLSLESTRDSLASRLALLQANPGKTPRAATERDALLARYSSLVDSNAAYHRNLPKLKLRIKDFVSKHFVTKTRTVLEAGRTLQGVVGREVAAVQGYWPAVIGLGALASSQVRRDKAEDGKVQRVLEALELPLYTPNSQLIGQLRVPSAVLPLDSAAHLVAEVTQIHRKWLQADTPSLGISRLQGIEIALNSEAKAITCLQSELIPTWQTQPAQYLLPWVRDSEGLNVQEWVDQWRSHMISVD